jgi:glycosyltransferase involved in cell wall biosynthesis
LVFSIVAMGQWCREVIRERGAGSSREESDLNCELNGDDLSSPRISVVLPTFNGERYIRECVESVLGQDEGEFELVVCDDGSVDGTLDIVQSFTDARVRVLRNERNRGLFATLNRLIRETRAELVHLWSQDDRMLPHCLSRTLEFAGKHPEVGMIYSAVHTIDAEGVRIPGGREDRTPAVIDSLLAARIMFYFGSISGNIANVAMRKSAFKALGGFREDLKVSGDYEMWVRLSEHYPLGFVREPLIELRQHREQFSRRTASGLQFIRENRAIHDRLLERLPPSERRDAVRYRQRFIQVKEFHHAVRCTLGGEIGQAVEVLRELRHESSVLPVAWRWITTVNGRLVSRP